MVDFLRLSERAERAEKAGKTVAQKGVFGESVFFSVPLRFALKTLEILRINREKRAVHFCVLNDRFSARRLLHSFSVPPGKSTLMQEACG